MQMRYSFVFESLVGSQFPIEVRSYTLDAKRDNGKLLLEQNEYSFKEYKLIKIFDNKKKEIVYIG